MRASNLRRVHRVALANPSGQRSPDRAEIEIADLNLLPEGFRLKIQFELFKMPSHWHSLVRKPEILLRLGGDDLEAQEAVERSS